MDAFAEIVINRLQLKKYTSAEMYFYKYFVIKASN